MKQVWFGGAWMGRIERIVTSTKGNCSRIYISENE